MQTKMGSVSRFVCVDACVTRNTQMHLTSTVNTKELPAQTAANRKLQQCICLEWVFFSLSRRFHFILRYSSFVIPFGTRSAYSGHVLSWMHARWINTPKNIWRACIWIVRQQVTELFRAKRTKTTLIQPSKGILIWISFLHIFSLG